MNAITKHEGATVPALAMDEAELVKVLQTSLYPGASLPSIKMALGYCKAAGLDPMQKPVHIVPMWDSRAGEMRDVIMPGIGLYRTQAARNGCAGVTEPEFGPDVTENIGGQEITYPAWCRVTVKRRLTTGELVEFTAKEFWKENYAVKGGKDKSIAPNAMWTKRPRGQIAKCTEAQALRKAFPEIGSEPTAEEMDGKVLNEGMVIDGSTGEIMSKKFEQLPPYPDENITSNLPAWAKAIKDGKAKSVDQIVAFIKSKNTLTVEQEQRIRAGCAQPSSDAPAFTAAEVLAKLKAAKTVDDLDAAAGLITAVSEAERAALNAHYDELRAKLIPEE